MNILVIGSGGREHALCWKLRQSPRCDRLYAAPGNPGMAREGECVALDAADHAAVVAFCVAKTIGMVVIGPEQPLVDGLADTLRGAGVRAFGPSAAAAQLEGSKSFTKALCRDNDIPTAAFARFDHPSPARAYVARHALPVVIKADGLAAGKGVVIARTRLEADAALDIMPGPVVIEAFLTGPEASLFVLCDGTTALPLASAQDYKRVGDGDTGPNTGGMGAVSPAPALTPELQAQAMREIVEPTVAAMAAAGTPFVGVLYAGLMLTPTGPQLIEYNVRFGDPECEVVMARLGSDLVDLLVATCDGTLDSVRPVWRDGVAVTVVMAADGYPGTPHTGTRIDGLDAAAASGALVFHAGTAMQDDGIVAAGGRVLAVTATGRDVGEARARAYAGVDKIDWADGFCRRDIGVDADARSGSRPRKFQRPPFLHEKLTQDVYERWLQRKAAAHIDRDRKRGNVAGSVSSYKLAIHAAVLDGGEFDYYTGEPLSWDLISTYDNLLSKAGGRTYKSRFALLPSVDHVGDGLCSGSFKICSWRTNDSKSDLSHDSFVALCRRVVMYHDEQSTIGV